MHVLMATKRKKKRSLKAKIGIGIAKGVWWTAKLPFKAAYHGGKLAYKGVKKSATQAKIKASRPKAEDKVAEIAVKKTVKGDFTEFQKRLQSASMIVLIAGRRGAGKSALGFALMEQIAANSNRKCFVLDVSQNVLPAYIRSVDSLDHVARGGIVLVDEGAIAFSARESMSKKNKQLGQLLAVARHKDLSLFLITQNTGMIDKNVLTLCDCIALKQGSLLQEKMERPALREFYQTAAPELKKQGDAYIFSHDFEGVINTALPTFWSDRVSKNQG